MWHWSAWENSLRRSWTRLSFAVPTINTATTKVTRTPLDKFKDYCFPVLPRDLTRNEGVWVVNLKSLGFLQKFINREGFRWEDDKQPKLNKTTGECYACKRWCTVVICPDRDSNSQMHCRPTTRCQPNILCEQQDIEFTPNFRDEVSHPKAEK